MCVVLLRDRRLGKSAVYEARDKLFGALITQSHIITRIYNHTKKGWLEGPSFIKVLLET